jgi:hypothetical protein
VCRAHRLSVEVYAPRHAAMGGCLPADEKWLSAGIIEAMRERLAAMAEELRKAELVRGRLEGLQRLVGTYPEGHGTRVLLEDLHLDRALGAVEEDIRVLVNRLVYPRGT